MRSGSSASGSRPDGSRGRRGWAIEAIDAEGTSRYAGNVDIRGGPAATIGFALHPWARGSAGQVANAWIATIAKGDDFSPRTHWLTVAVLRGERILLRPQIEADIPRIVEACSDAASLQGCRRCPRRTPRTTTTR